MKKVLLVLSVLCLCASFAGAQTTHQVASTSADSISAAVAGAASGDIIELIDAGPYVETVALGSKAITLRATVAATISVDGTNFVFPTVDGIAIGDDTGETITIKPKAGLFGIYAYSLPDGATINVENVIFDLSNGAHNGIYGANGTNDSVNNVVMTNCTFKNDGGTAAFYSIYNKGADFDDATYKGGTNVVANDCTFEGNVNNHIYALDPEGLVTLNDCTLAFSNAGTSFPLYANNGDITVDGGTVFGTNAAVATAYAVGGTIILKDADMTMGTAFYFAQSLAGGTVTLDGSTLDATSLYANGIQLVGGTVNIIGSTIVGFSNIAVQVTSTGSVLNVSESIFSNTLYYDIYATEGTLDIFRSVFSSQYCIAIGGPAAGTIDNCDFLGGYYNVYSNDDQVTGDITITDSILCGEYGIWNKGSGIWTSNNNCHYNSAIYGTVAQAGNLTDVDPLYTNPPTGWGVSYPLDLSGMVWPDDLVPAESQVLTGASDSGTMGSTLGTPVSEWKLY